MAEISPLRRRMIEDMTVRNLSPATQQSYLNAVSKFSRYFGRSPERLGLEDVHAFQVHLVATGSHGLRSIRSSARCGSSMA
jgi:integrase/recombinase XerD